MADNVRTTTMGARDITEAGALPGMLKRISWGAIFAGVIVALVVELVLSLLGLGIGLGVVSPAEGAPLTAGIGIGAGIWFVITTILALFAGGWVAGRLAGFPRSLTGTLHGVVMWGVVTLVSFYLMTTTAGMLISGVAGVIGKGLSLMASGLTAAAPQVGEQLQQRGITVDSIVSQGQQILAQTGRPELQPGAPGQSQALAESLKRLFANPLQVGSPQDREAVINALSSQTGMSREQALAQVDNWVQQYYQTRQQAAGQAKEAAGQATSILSKAALLAFVALILGAIAAGLGGALGAPRTAYEGLRE